MPLTTGLPSARRAVQGRMEGKTTTVTTTVNTLQAGTYAIIRDGQDDIADGQVCRVLARDQEPNYRPGDYAEGTDLMVYTSPEGVLVECWTGYRAWTAFDNLIPILIPDPPVSALALLFVEGNERVGDMVVEF